MQLGIGALGSLSTRPFLSERRAHVALNTVQAVLKHALACSDLHPTRKPEMEMWSYTTRGKMGKWSAFCGGSGVRFIKAKVFPVHKHCPPVASLAVGW